MSAADYWAREFIQFGREWRTVSVELICPDPERAAAAIRLKAAGVGGNEPRGVTRTQMGPDYPKAPLALSVHFQLPHSTQTASIARKLFEDCDLERFLISESPNESSIGEIKARIEALAKEFQEGQEALSKLPIAKALMDAKLNRLTKALEATSPETALDVIYLGLRYRPKESPVVR